MYFASDSRISWDKVSPTWDTGVKLFAPFSSPEIMGFTGYTSLPLAILKKACDIIDRGLRLPEDSIDYEAKRNWLFRIIQSEIHKHPGHPHLKGTGFSIIYGMRFGAGMPDKSSFNLSYYKWDDLTKTLSFDDITIPSSSSILKMDGSGKNSINKWKVIWERSDQANTSRTMFSAFCDALRSGKDPYSGGEPQLIGLYRTGNSRIFGVVTENGASYMGVLDQEIESSKIEWRDRLFQRVTSSGKLLKTAQKHAIPEKVQRQYT